MVFSPGQVLTAAGLNGVTLGNFSTYTPAVGNDGTATYTTKTGWYCKIGTSKLVFVNIYIQINAAGSGASDLTMTAPTNIERSNRQVVSGEYVDGTNIRIGHLVALTSGATNVFDKVRVTNATTSGASTMSGAGMAANAFFCFQGFYREA